MRLKLAPSFAGRVLALFLLAATVAAQPGDKTKMTKEVSIGGSGISFHEYCGSVSVLMHHDDFFEGLERIHTPDGVVFRKKRKTYSHFPETFAVLIHFRLRYCGKSTPQDPGFIKPETAVNSLQLELEWKSDTETRDAEVAEMEVLPPFWGDMADLWTIRLEIRAPQVPLTDRLIVTLYSKDGKLIASCAAALGEVKPSLQSGSVPKLRIVPVTPSSLQPL
jgi:hypothetical protein